ncbi:MAG: phosphonoacetaldehyde reductase [Holosporales bacterium]|jgi:alcohol dehydrogenase|nr:phosphonoacetaldehyde reductase [Holosporales bacterium]
MSWHYSNPVRIYSGEEALGELRVSLEKKRVLLVTTEGTVARGTADRLKRKICSAHWVMQTVPPNPELTTLTSYGHSLAQEKPEALVALGGGSAIDSAKVLAVLLMHPKRSLETFLREEQKEVLPSALPLFSIPTTAGTGAEVTPFATLWDKIHLKKYSLESHFLYAQAAFLIPEWTASLPWKETLWGVLDTLSHSLETLWNRHMTPLSALFAREAIRLVTTFLPMVQKEGQALAARTQLQQASCYAGLAISQNKTALAHALSYPLTLRYGVPHGLACSFTLLALIKEIQARHLWRCTEDAVAAELAANLLRILTLPEEIRKFCSSEQIEDLVQEAHLYQSRAGNFILNLSDLDLRTLLQRSLCVGN